MEFNLRKTIIQIPTKQLQLTFLKEFVFKHRKELGVSIDLFKEEYFRVKDQDNILPEKSEIE